MLDPGNSHMRMLSANLVPSMELEEPDMVESVVPLAGVLVLGTLGQARFRLRTRNGHKFVLYRPLS